MSYPARAKGLGKYDYFPNILASSLSASRLLMPKAEFDEEQDTSKSEAWYSKVDEEVTLHFKN